MITHENTGIQSHFFFLFQRRARNEDRIDRSKNSGIKSIKLFTLRAALLIICNLFRLCTSEELLIAMIKGAIHPFRRKSRELTLKYRQRTIFTIKFDLS